MIAKGNLHAHGAKLAAYLTDEKKGDRAELAELRGFAADNIRDAFIDVEIQSKATRCAKPFFHAYVRLPAHEHLTPEQWQVAAGRIEKRLGFDGQPRAIAFHYKEDGGTHMHVVWSCIDLETMKAIDPGLYKNRLKELCRELEREFGLTVVRSDRDPEQKTRAAGRNEFEQSRRLDTDLKVIRETIRACWDRSDNGRAFEAALEERGLILARGDRRDFVVIDREGGTHALGKRIVGVTAPEIRARLSDMDRDRIPSVSEARIRQQTRAREHQVEPRIRPTPTAARQADPHAENSAAPTRVRAAGASGATRGAGRMLDGVARAAGSILDSIGNMFAPSAAAKPAPQQKEPPPMATPEPTPHSDAVRREEQARAERVQALVNKYGVAPSPEMERDAELRPGRERERDRDRER
jgi:hypothetical protein